MFGGVPGGIEGERSRQRIGIGRKLTPTPSLNFSESMDDDDEEEEEEEGDEGGWERGRGRRRGDEDGVNDSDDTEDQDQDVDGELESAVNGLEHKGGSRAGNDYRTRDPIRIGQEGRVTDGESDEHLVIERKKKRKRRRPAVATAAAADIVGSPTDNDAEDVSSVTTTETTTDTKTRTKAKTNVARGGEKMATSSVLNGDSTGLVEPSDLYSSNSTSSSLNPTQTQASAPTSTPLHTKRSIRWRDRESEGRALRGGGSHSKMTIDDLPGGDGGWLGGASVAVLDLWGGLWQTVFGKQAQATTTRRKRRRKVRRVSTSASASTSRTLPLTVASNSREKETLGARSESSRSNMNNLDQEVEPGDDETTDVSEILPVRSLEGTGIITNETEGDIENDWDASMMDPVTRAPEEEYPSTQSSSAAEDEFIPASPNIEKPKTEIEPKSVGESEAEAEATSTIPIPRTKLLLNPLPTDLLTPSTERPLTSSTLLRPRKSDTDTDTSIDVDKNSQSRSGSLIFRNRARSSTLHPNASNGMGMVKVTGTGTSRGPIPKQTIPSVITPFHLRKTLILDLDETLIHSTSRPMNIQSSGMGGGGGLAGISLAGLFPGSSGRGGGGARGEGHTVEVVLGGRSTLYHVYKRPFVDHFLKKVSDSTKGKEKKRKRKKRDGNTPSVSVGPAGTYHSLPPFRFL